MLRVPGTETMGQNGAGLPKGMLVSRRNVVVVVVAYNRQELLAKCLDGLAEQTVSLTGAVIVDNASTDDSGRVAREHRLGESVDVDVVGMPVNTGGAGGFTAGIARALARFPEADWVWLMDDDTVPTDTALESLLDAAEAYEGEPALLASRAVWHDGSEHPMNRPRTRPALAPKLYKHAEAVGARQVRTASFVSVLIDVRAVRETGLPCAAYFLWNDDFDYTARILRRRVGLYVPGSVVHHLTKALGSSDADPGERFRYETRNKLWTFRGSEGFGPLERLAFEAATARRWVRAVVGSTDRDTLWRAGKQGMREGIGLMPSNMTVMLGTPVQDEVAALEAAARIRRDDAECCAARSSSLPTGSADDAELPAFSVLLPVYRGDDASFLRRSLASVTVDQELRPDEVVIVRDGPVPEELEEVLVQAETGSLSGGVPVRVERLKENHGLALALEAGLAVVTHDVVARQDADDISLPSRFASQVPLIAAGYDLVGSALQEFDDESDTSGMVRVQPADQAAIRRAMTLRDPFHHPTVIYRASVVRAAGGYQHLDLMEDYWLFARVVAGGAPTMNVPEVLVRYRVGAGAYARRGGTRLLRSELELQRRLRDVGVTTRGQHVRNVAIRATYRLVPTRLRQVAYRVGQRVLLSRTR